MNITVKKEDLEYIRDLVNKYEAKANRKAIDHLDHVIGLGISGSVSFNNTTAISEDEILDMLNNLRNESKQLREDILKVTCSILKSKRPTSSIPKPKNT